MCKHGQYSCIAFSRQGRKAYQFPFSYLRKYLKMISYLIFISQKNGMLRKYYSIMLTLLKDVCMRRVLEKIVWQPKRERSLIFETLFLYGGINFISRIITLLLALLEAVLKHTKILSKRLLPCTPRPLYIAPANQFSETCQKQCLLREIKSYLTGKEGNREVV